MTPKPAGQSLVYPCPNAYQGEFCGGIAALVNGQYVCMKCAWTWNIHGQPTGEEAA